MFADDTQLFNRDEESIEETFKVLNIHVYEKNIMGKNKFK